MEQLTGYAAVFHAFSDPIGGDFVEVIRPGAFAKSLRTADVRFLWNHDAALPLGRVGAGNLTLAEDHHGLQFSLDLPDTATGRDLLELVRTKVIYAMSFGFNIPSGGDTWRRGSDGGLPIRELTTINLLEISGTTFPAYPQTSIGLRDAAQARRAIPGSHSTDIARRRLALTLVA